MGKFGAFVGSTVPVSCAAPYSYTPIVRLVCLVLQHLGYAKWDYTPTGRGFDSYVGYLQGKCDYYNKTIGGAKGQQAGYDFWKNQTRNSDADDGSYTMATYQAEAERLAAEVWSAPGADPFFLYYAQQEIHIPLERPPQGEHVQHCAKVTSNPERLTLCSMTSALDAEVGRFVADLKARGLWDNTLLWVITDNGGMTGFNPDYSFPASASSNWPLRAGKTTLFEGGVRGVSFINGGALPAAARGTESHELMHAADVPVTLAKLAGADADVAGLDGVDLMPTIASGAKGARTEVPINVNPKCVACKQQTTSKATAVPYSALLQRSADGQHDWKLVSGYAGVYDDYWTNEDRGYARLPAPANDTDLPPSAWRLYDIANDETESRNVAAENPSVVQTMVARLAELGDASKGYVKPQLNIPAVGPLGKKSAPSAANNYTWAPFLN